MYSAITQLTDKLKTQLQRHRDIQGQAQSNFQPFIEEDLQLI